MKIEKLELSGTDVEALLGWLLRWIHRAVKLKFAAVQLWDGRIVKIEENEMAYLLRDDQKVTLAIQPVDSYGNPARVDGIPAWGSSDEALLTLEVAADGMSAVALPVGPLGTVQVNVTADADLGAGIKPIAGVLDIQVEPGEAVSVNISAGTPEPK